MHTSEDETQDRIQNAVDAQDDEALSCCVRNAASFCFGSPPDKTIHCYSDEFVTFLEKIIASENFLRMKGAWSLLVLFEYDWSLFSFGQRERIRAVLESVYGKFSDWMGSFMVAKILGDYYADWQSLSVLHGLSNISDEFSRSLVIVGLEYLAKRGNDLELARQARAEIVNMASDVSPKVRAEAAASISRLGAAGGVESGRLS